MISFWSYERHFLQQEIQRTIHNLAHLKFLKGGGGNLILWIIYNMGGIVPPVTSMLVSKVLNSPIRKSCRWNC